MLLRLQDEAVKPGAQADVLDALVVSGVPDDAAVGAGPGVVRAELEGIGVGPDAEEELKRLKAEPDTARTAEPGTKTNAERPGMP